MKMMENDKYDLAREVKRQKYLGFKKTEAIERIHKMYLWNKRTIAVYWEVFNESNPPQAEKEKKVIEDDKL